MRRAAVTLVLVGVLVGVFAPVAQAGKGVFTIEPPGRDGEATAMCVGPEWDKTAAVGNMNPWNAHFNSTAVIHDFDCEH